MSLEMIVSPVYALACDFEGCDEEIRDRYDWPLRRDAARDGWSVRPVRGKGSRSAPDLCPKHAGMDR